MKSTAFALLTIFGAVTLTACDEALLQQQQPLPRPQEPLPIQAQQQQQARSMTPLCSDESGKVVCQIR